MAHLVSRHRARLLHSLVVAACLVGSTAGTAIDSAAQVATRPIPSSTPVIYKAQPEDKTAIIQFLDALDRGELVTLTFESRNAFKDAWDKVAGAWLRAPDTDRDRRRRILALAILQAGYDALNSMTWQDVRWLIEWECDQIRRGPTTEFEHVWLSASVVLIQAAGDRSFLEPPKLKCERLQPCNHAWHAVSRFPDDRRFRLAHALPVQSTKPFARQPGALLEDPRFGTPEFTERLRDTFDGLRAFATDPVVGPETRLMMGLLHYALNEIPECLRELKAAGASSDDAYVRYVATFVTGLVHDAQGRADDAMRHYEAALVALPNVRSGATWLAAKYFLAGRRDDAFALMDKVYAAPAPKIDPWHRTDTLRVWSDLFERMRELVRR